MHRRTSCIGDPAGAVYRPRRSPIPGIAVRRGDKEPRRERERERLFVCSPSSRIEGQAARRIMDRDRICPVCRSTSPQDSVCRAVTGVKDRFFLFLHRNPIRKVSGGFRALIQLPLLRSTPTIHLHLTPLRGPCSRFPPPNPQPHPRVTYAPGLDSNVTINRPLSRRAKCLSDSGSRT